MNDLPAPRTRVEPDEIVLGALPTDRHHTAGEIYRLPRDHGPAVHHETPNEARHSSHATRAPQPAPSPVGVAFACLLMVTVFALALVALAVIAAVN